MASQHSRVFELKTPLGKDQLLLRRMSGTEALSRPFEWQLDLLSAKGDIDGDKLLGQKVSIALTLPNKKQRYFQGYVTEFSQGGWLQRTFEYRAVVRPWFWLLTRTSDCHIYQDLTVPQIFEELLKQYAGIADYELRLKGTYQPWEYCVQYRETDFNFLSRLLEQEGIYYFFEHTDAKHTMVLVDDPGSHKAVAGYETVPFYPPGGADTQRERDHLEAWSWTKAVQPGTFATTDFDFETPRKSLAGSETISRRYEQSSFEIFDYPAELSKLDGQQSGLTAKIRIEELQVNYMVARGHGNAAGLVSGALFTLDKFPRKDLNIDYVITQATYTLTADAYEPGQPQSADEFLIHLEAIDAKTPFRPERLTSKPVVQGAQTAMVVGKAGDEIYTDKYGRVKVQFPWDRHGKSDEKSSCWIRVSQLWAGKQWGGIHIPRIGQEVIVGFLEGDPDQPIIIGRVYNGDSMPPYGLPGNATQSGIKSRSSKGGSDANFNEFRFEDKKGSELVTLHAEKDQSVSVENDENVSIGHDRAESVGHDETITIGNNRTEKVGVNETITIGANRKEDVGANETIAIGANRTITVGASESASVALQRTHNVGVNETISVGAAQEINVGAAQTITVGAAQSTTVGASQSTTVGADRSVSVGGNQSTSIGSAQTVSVGADLGETVGGNHVESVSKSLSIKAGEDAEVDIAKNLNLVAGDEIVIKSGDASITLKKDGTISIKGKDIQLEASGKITGKAGGDFVLKGSKVTLN